MDNEQWERIRAWYREKTFGHYEMPPFAWGKATMYIKVDGKWKPVGNVISVSYGKPTLPPMTVDDLIALSHTDWLKGVGR